MLGLKLDFWPFQPCSTSKLEEHHGEQAHQHIEWLYIVLQKPKLSKKQVGTTCRAFYWLSQRLTRIQAEGRWKSVVYLQPRYCVAVKLESCPDTPMVGVSGCFQNKNLLNNNMDFSLNPILYYVEFFVAFKSIVSPKIDPVVGFTHLMSTYRMFWLSYMRIICTSQFQRRLRAGITTPRDGFRDSLKAILPVIRKIIFETAPLCLRRTCTVSLHNSRP